MQHRDADPDSTLQGKSARSTRLYSWKHIAAYFGRDVRTVCRWEKTEGLPVHRIQHAKSDSVFANIGELENWLASRSGRVEGSSEPVSPVAGARYALFWPALLVAITVLAAVAGAISYFKSPPSSTVRAVVLTNDPGVEREPSFSPDGTQVAYVWNGDAHKNFDIYVRTVSAGSERRVTTDARDDYSPAWSPDGASIAFLRQTAAIKAAVLIVGAAGGIERTVAEITTGLWPSWHRPGPFLAWSPDEKYLVAVARAGPQNVDQLLRIGLSNGEMRPLTSPAATTMGDSGPAISPDGKMLAFSRKTSWGVSKLCILPLSPDLMPAGEVRELETESTWNESPAWLPNRGELIFSTGRMDHTHIAKIASSGSTRAAPLAGVGEYGWHPSVATARGDRLRLVYTQHFESVNIWKQPVDGTADPEQVIASAHWSYEPDCSPDGERIAFLSDRSGNPEVWVAASDGRNPKQWTFLNRPSLGAPRWSPDNRRVAFTVPGADGSSVYLVDGPGKLPRLVAGSHHCGYIAWAPDGRAIYFSSNRGGSTQIWKIAPDGGEAVQVTTRGGRVPGVSPHGHLYYLRLASAAGDSRLFRMPLAGGEEETGPEFVDAYSVSDAGIAFKYYRPGATPEGPYLRFFRFATGKTKALPPPPKPLRYGIALSPNGRDIIYSQADFEVSDLMFVENLR